MVQTLNILTTNLNELKDNGLYNEIDIEKAQMVLKLILVEIIYHLSSNNYLGLATDELKKLLRLIDTHGVSAGAVRINGTLDLHKN